MTELWLKVPEGVDVTCKSRILTVKGKRGSVTKNFRHLTCELKKMKQDTPKRKGTFIRIRVWFGSKGDISSTGTVKGLIKNMFVGVTEVSHRFKHFSHQSSQRGFVELREFLSPMVLINN